MKKLLLFALIAITITAFNACSKDDNDDNNSEAGSSGNFVDDSSIIEFKDPLFLNAILEKGNIDQNNDNQISIKEAENVTSLAIYNIRNLDEICYFTALRSLSCSGDQLTSLDVSKLSELVNLECSNSQISSLDLKGNTKLVGLICQNNKLSSLDISKNQYLRTLECNNNELTALNLNKNPELLNYTVLIIK